jgi:hypothetical protein
MDFLLSSSFLRFEIYFLIINVIYIFFHFFFEIFSLFSRIKNIIKPKRIHLNEEELKAAILEKTEAIDTVELPLNQAQTVKAQDFLNEETKIYAEQEIPAEVIKIDPELSKDQKDEISDITKLAKSKISK